MSSAIEELEIIQYEDVPLIDIKLPIRVDPTKTQHMAKEIAKIVRRGIKEYAGYILELFKKYDLKKSYFEPDYNRVLRELDTIMIDLDAFTKNVLTTLLSKGYEQGVTRATADLTKQGAIEKGQRIPETMRDVELKSALQNMTTHLITSVQKKFIDDIKFIIQKAIIEGTPFKDVKNQIKVKANTSMSAAERIARTEMVRSYNSAAETRYKQTGVKYVVWQASRRRAGEQPDERTCEVCTALHGRIVPVGKPFAKLKGKEILRPPDPHPNCRCTIRPIIIDQQKEKIRVKAAKAKGLALMPIKVRF